MSSRSPPLGESIFSHCSPSVVRKIVPLWPINQQIPAAGAVPATSSSLVPLLSGCHFTPSLERATTPPGVTLHLVKFPEEAITIGLVIDTCSTALSESGVVGPFGGTDPGNDDAWNRPESMPLA